MKLTKDIIIERLKNLVDIDFVYKGKQGSICPFSFDNISVAYDDKVKDYASIEAIMEDVGMFDGNTIVDICQDFSSI